MSSDASILSFSMCVLIFAHFSLIRDPTLLIGEHKCKLLGIVANKHCTLLYIFIIEKKMCNFDGTLTIAETLGLEMEQTQQLKTLCVYIRCHENEEKCSCSNCTH